MRYYNSDSIVEFVNIKITFAPILDSIPSTGKDFFTTEMYHQPRMPRDLLRDIYEVLHKSESYILLLFDVSYDIRKEINET